MDDLGTMELKELLCKDAVCLCCGKETKLIILGFVHKETKRVTGVLPSTLLCASCADVIEKKYGAKPAVGMIKIINEKMEEYIKVIKS